MIEYLITLVIENYGPIGLLAVLLWRRQSALTGAVLTLAEEQPSVDEDRVRESVRFFKR